MPPLRMMVLPASEVHIIDTWTVSGLCGTGSHDFVLDEVFVPADHTFTVFQPGGLEGTLGRIPELMYSALAIATVAVGIAHGALADITTLATAKVPMFADGTLASNPLFRYRLAEADTQLRAAQALLDADVATTWEIATADEEFTPERRARIRSTATWVTALPPRWSTSPTRPAVAPRCTRSSPCSGDFATSMPSPSTSWSSRTRSPSPGRCSPAKTSTSASCDRGRGSRTRR